LSFVVALPGVYCNELCIVPPKREIVCFLEGTIKPVSLSVSFFSALLAAVRLKVDLGQNLGMDSFASL